MDIDGTKLMLGLWGLISGTSGRTEWFMKLRTESNLKVTETHYQRCME